MTPVMQLLALIATVLTSAVIGTWVISNKIGSIKTDLTAQMQVLEKALRVEIQIVKTDLAVMKEAQENRDQKINRMWEWWLKSLENGWAAHMTARPKEGPR